MKKIYSLFVLCLAFYGVQAQSFTATNVYVSGNPLFLLEGHATINNISGTSKDVLVERTYNDVFPGHSSYFCWVQCYSPQTSVSPDPNPIPAGGFTDIFRGDLDTYAISGISNVNYCFYDANNIQDSVCVQYVFDATTGINEVPSNKNYLSKPYPNPASASTSFYVSLLKGYDHAEIRFFNMLGAEVKSVSINDSKNTIKVNVSDLKAGIYFYSLWVDGKTSGTGKLMVTQK